MGVLRTNGCCELTMNVLWLFSELRCITRRTLCRLYSEMDIDVQLDMTLPKGRSTISRFHV